MRNTQSLQLKALTFTILLLGSAVSWGQAWDHTLDQPWVLRVRATQLKWANEQNNGLAALNVSAQNLSMPEVDVSYFINENVAFELSWSYAQRVYVDVGAVGAGSLRALPPSLTVQYHFTHSDVLKPYMGFGVNYTTFTSLNILNGSATVNSTSTGGVGQAGLDYMLDQNWGLNFDLKFTQMKSDVYLSGAKKGELGLNPSAYSVGVSYRY